MSNAEGLASEAAAVRLRPSILMLDDDGFMLHMMSRMLHGLGYTRVGQASSAQQALATLQVGNALPDVIICDLNLPGIDGIEFLQRVRDMGFRGGVVLLSGEGLRILHTVQKLLGGGGLVVLGAIEKPASRTALQTVLDRWQPVVDASAGLPRQEISRADLQEALAGAFWVLHFQPKVALRSGELSGVEALLRMDHPRLGLVGPDQFIGLAEEAGSIDALTEWVAQNALRQLASWTATGMRLQMAINLSMNNLSVPGFAARIGAHAASCGVSAHDVVLEITESRLMDSSTAPLENLVRLRLRRFQLSIDDFGTGHSSLAQLRDVPFTELKIDRSFVNAARYNQITRPMLEGSLGLARKLGMRSVAEGVETQDDWQLLSELDCDLAQGWFIGRPMAAAQLPAWLQSWKLRCPRLLAS